MVGDPTAPSGLRGAGPTTVGEQLRAARERQGLELPAIARALRIPAKTLEALEAGDVARLPAAVYVRGFLKQYAAVLGLDPVPLLRQHELERARAPVRAPAPPWVLPARSARPSLWDFVTPRTLARTGGGLLLALVLLYVLGQFRTYVRPPRLLIAEPPHDVETTESVYLVRGHTDATAELSINGERTVVREDGSFEESVGLGEGVNTLRIVAKSIGGRETVAVREVLVRPPPREATADLRPERVGPPAEALAKAGPFTLTVRAEGESVWVMLGVDGKTAFQGLLLAGSEHTVSGSTITVTSGKAARTRIRIDGAEQGPLADSPGVVRDVAFTRNTASGTVERHERPTPTLSPLP